MHALWACNYSTVYACRVLPSDVDLVGVTRPLINDVLDK